MFTYVEFIWVKTCVCARTYVCDVIAVSGFGMSACCAWIFLLNFTVLSFTFLLKGV